MQRGFVRKGDNFADIRNMVGSSCSKGLWLFLN